VAGELDRDEAAWRSFDAALRRAAEGDAEPPAALRAACLPGHVAAEPEAEPARSPFRVLVVDDEPNIRRLICLHLAQAGYEVSEACDGPEALAQVAAVRPHLMVLDVMMPGLNGFQVLAALKGDPRTADLQVVMLTAKDGDDHIRYGWQIGADFYMCKPFNPIELRRLLDRMVAVLGTPESPPPLRRWLK